MMGARRAHESARLIQVGIGFVLALACLTIVWARLLDPQVVIAEQRLRPVSSWLSSSRNRGRSNFAAATWLTRTARDTTLGTHYEPVYRRIVGIDIERYSRIEWTDPIRARLRERLYRLVNEALVQAAIDPALTSRSDTGDGLWLLVAAEVSSARLLHPLVAHIVNGLREENKETSAAECMRLRFVVHAGEVLRDAHGETGASVIHAARLLDAQAGRVILSRSAEATAVLMVSDVIYEGVVRHGYEGIDRAGWQAIRVHAKETSTRAWVHLPGLATQPSILEEL
jgi:hypothetical protein